MKVIFCSKSNSSFRKISTSLWKICNSIKEKKDGKTIWFPTVIFEFEGSTSKEVIKELFKTAKQISLDKVQARCILLLSDANACISMTSGF